MMPVLGRLFTPDARTTPRDRLTAALAWFVIGLLLWQTIDIRFIPKPLEVLHAFSVLQANGDLLEIGTSVYTMIRALLWTVVIAHALAYASCLAAVRPLATFVAGWRYFGLVGLVLPFTLLAPDNDTLKVALLTYGMTVFYLRSLLDIVQAVPEEQYDHARTLGMSQARMLYEAVVLGTLYDSLIALRTNAAMGWMMLTAVESISRSQGGIGVVLSNMDKHMSIDQEAAILVILALVGLLQSFAIGFLANRILCPYGRLGRGH